MYLSVNKLTATHFHDVVASVSIAVLLSACWRPWLISWMKWRKWCYSTWRGERCCYLNRSTFYFQSHNNLLLWFILQECLTANWKHGVWSVSLQQHQMALSSSTFRPHWAGCMFSTRKWSQLILKELSQFWSSIFSLGLFYLFHCRNCTNSLSCQMTGPTLEEPMFTTFPMSPIKMDTYETPTWSSHIPPWTMDRYQPMPGMMLKSSKADTEMHSGFICVFSGVLGSGDLQLPPLHAGPYGWQRLGLCLSLPPDHLLLVPTASLCREPSAHAQGHPTGTVVVLSTYKQNVQTTSLIASCF